MIETFWHWLLFRAEGKSSGWKLLFGWKNLADVAIAATMTFALSVDGFEFAAKALFPAASIFVSMSIAWTSRAATIINDKNFREKIVRSERPLEDYVYGFQLSLLIIMITVVYIAIMAAGGFKFYIYNEFLSRMFSSIFMYIMIVWSVRECWSVVNFTNLLGLLADRVERTEKDNESE